MPFIFAMSCGKTVMSPASLFRQGRGKCPLPHHRRFSVGSVQYHVWFLVNGAGQRALVHLDTCLPRVCVSVTDVHQKKYCAGKVVFFLEYAYKFSDLVQTLLHLSKVVGECHVHHPFFAKCTEAFFFQQLRIWSKPIFCSKFCGYIMVQKYY